MRTADELSDATSLLDGASITRANVGSDIVLITGCSRGIGRVTAEVLAAAGYHVVATARDPETLQDVGAEMALRLDVTDADSIAAAVAEVLDRYGRIDVLVNNAGYAVRGAIEELNVDAVGYMVDLNMLGIIRMVHTVTPIMHRQGWDRWRVSSWVRRTVPTQR
jgi:NADP-dependent 3-hydroxy acid dehydrogenase YdfG